MRYVRSFGKYSVFQTEAADEELVGVAGCAYWAGTYLVFETTFSDPVIGDELNWSDSLEGAMGIVERLINGENAECPEARFRRAMLAAEEIDAAKRRDEMGGI